MSSRGETKRVGKRKVREQLEEETRRKIIRKSE